MDRPGGTVPPIRKRGRRVSQKAGGHSLGRQEWTVETYRGGLLFGMRSIVYGIEPDDPTPTQFVYESTPVAQQSSDVNARDTFSGRLGFASTRYSHVVSESPVVTRFGQSIGLPIWLFTLCFAVWPVRVVLAMAKQSALRRHGASQSGHNQTLQWTGPAPRSS